MTRLFEEGDVRLDVEGARLAVGGDVDFEVAAGLAASGSAWLAQQPAATRLVLDLSGVDRVSSAALSVLLEWTRCAEAAGLVIDSVTLSAPLARLTRMAGLDTLLPDATAA
ncbi:STAS domain-containing protein [Halomonas sp. ML-15]|uniref:STAS domain-containing protein n=1 Tax=Halomonas sp. ML-15 TaxID=2773305 RepID=UPI001746C7E4|nr:STAS domain-containing protein [Halomonas sp. ML-15]MBD3897374.1 STAS domain-containing protein [Halomonas sp. ML-15]